MYALKVKHADAQRVLEQLKKIGALAHGYRFQHDTEHIYIPLATRVLPKPFHHYQRVQRTFLHYLQPTDFNQILQKIVPRKNLAHLRHSIEFVGTIAILELDRALQPYERRIAQALLRTHKTITTVVKKRGGHTGIYRLQRYQHLAGQRTKETTHKENGVRMRLHLEKTYFSPRLAHERLRIAHQVKRGENILVMFSGIAAYPLVLAKNSRAHHITGIEINKDACTYARENVRLNKFANITPYCGDVRTIIPNLHYHYDRIIMPLPHGAATFLEVARQCSTKGTIIHYYQFLAEDAIPQALAAIRQVFPKIKLLHTIKCGQQKPRIWRYCLDFKVLTQPKALNISTTN